MNYDYKTELILRKWWEKAYTEGKVLVPVPLSNNPIAATITYNKLINYRRSIRALRLNPLYKDQWSRLSKCTAQQPRVNSTHIQLRRKCTAEFIRKLKIDYSKHPFNKFNIPKGVEYGD